jgi:hypothetical protein
MRFGLLQASFIPPKGQRDLRDLTRYRTKLVQERVVSLDSVYEYERAISSTVSSRFLYKSFVLSALWADFSRPSRA